MISLNNVVKVGHWLTALFLVLVVTSASAQKSNTVTGSFSAATFESFVKTIEQQTNFKFYYDHLQTDSLSITVSASNDSIGNVLDIAFSGTPLHYSVYGNNVFVIKDRQMMTTLPADFFNESQKTVSKKDNAAFDLSDYERQEQLRKRVEERLTYIGTKTNNLTGNATINGIVRDIKSGEAIIGASVFVENPLIGVATDQLGRYSLTLPRGRHEIKIKSVGMKTTQRQVMLYNNGKLEVDLEEDITPLKEVIVTSERDVKITSTDMGLEKLDIKIMKQMPLILGEADVMKVVLTLPGVQTVGEGTVGLNVRGGATNQNLILFNDAVVYNPSHMFGFFSTFNPDVLKNVELYKSGVTADYGGRLSSVLDVTARDGNLKKFSASGGLSPVTGRLTLEGPIIKERSSFIVGVRSTYSDWLLKQVNNPALKNSSAAFYDITANINHKINDNNTITVSGYMSRDRFQLTSDTSYHYSDRNGSVKWKHQFNPNFYSTVIGAASQYTYTISSERNPVNAFNMDFKIRQFNGKADFNYLLNQKHALNAGVAFTHYFLAPGNMQPSGEKSLIVPDVLPVNVLSKARYT
ncbi:MAG: carboxypeptidase-like regulatory domain-containing protein [Bacteroidota bacterium]